MKLYFSIFSLIFLLFQSKGFLLPHGHKGRREFSPLFLCWLIYFLPADPS